MKLQKKFSLCASRALFKCFAIEWNSHRYTKKKFRGKCVQRKKNAFNFSSIFGAFFSERLQKECLALHSEREQIHSTAVMQFRRIMKLLLQYCTCIWILKNVDFEKWGRRRRRRRKRHAEWNTFREVLTFFILSSEQTMMDILVQTANRTKRFIKSQESHAIWSKSSVEAHTKSRAKSRKDFILFSWRLPATFCHEVSLLERIQENIILTISLHCLSFFYRAPV